MESITVKNESGQVVSLSFTGDTDPRKAIVEARIQRGELEKVGKSSKSERVMRRNRRPVEDYHTGLRDEKGDLLKSVHGGGLDPDADGDELGQPSGSKHTEGAVVIDAEEPVGDSHPDAAEEAPEPKKTAVKKTAASK